MSRGAFWGWLLLACVLGSCADRMDRERVNGTTALDEAKRLIGFGQEAMRYYNAEIAALRDSLRVRDSLLLDCEMGRVIERAAYRDSLRRCHDESANTNERGTSHGEAHETGSWTAERGRDSGTRVAGERGNSGSPPPAHSLRAERGN